MTNQTKTKRTPKPKPKSDFFGAVKARLPGKARAITTTHPKTRTVAFDIAEHLRTPEEMALYIDACILESDGDAAFVAKALGDVARAQGMSKVARDSGLSRESLYKALSGERSPDFSTILKVTRALGVKMHFAAA
jgi:probable addiction module antidote protein